MKHNMQQAKISLDNANKERMAMDWRCYEGSAYQQLDISMEFEKAENVLKAECSIINTEMRAMYQSVGVDDKQEEKCIA